MAVDAAAPAAPPRRRARPLPVRAAARAPVPGRRHDPRPLVRARAGADGPQGPARLQAVVPRAARKAARVLTVSERTRRDLRELYGVPDAKIVVTPNGVDPVFTPGNGWCTGDYVLFVGAVQERKNPLAALAAAERCRAAARRRRPGEGRGARARARAARRRASRGYVDQDELVRPLPRRRLPRPAVPLRGLRPARARGDGVRDAGRRRRPSRRCGRSPATRPSGPRRTSSATGSAARVADRDRLVAAGLERARALLAGARPRGARSRSTGRCSGGEGLRGRRLARARRASSSARCRRSRRRSTSCS